VSGDCHGDHSSPSGSDRFERVRRAMIAVRDAREWKQFHDPKNLAEGLSLEAAELLEVFQWKTTDEARALTGDAAAQAKVAEEVADCFLYCVLVADAFCLDLIEAAQRKLAANEMKYPLDKSRGRRDKYDAL
jgi:NTP pyrophosphatase (non-canonical NTP hydrolase)